MSGHTPGPWDIHVEQSAGIFGSSAVYVCGGQGWPEGQLARVNTQDGMGEREANARLIAAVPELFDALQWISSNYENGNLNHVDFRVEAKHLADAALAKARGAA